MNGPLTVNTDLTPNGDITLNSGGSIICSGSLGVGTDFTWLGGTLGLTGGAVINGSGELKADGSDGKTLTTTLTVDSSYVDLDGTGGLLVSGSSGLFDIAIGTARATLPSISTAFGRTFELSGSTLDIESPASTPTAISGHFINNGTLDVAANDAATLSDGGGGSGTVDFNGTLGLDGDLTILGTIDSPLGFIENAGGGTLKLGDGSSGGSLSIAGGQEALVSGNLEVTTSGSLGGAGELYNNGKVTLDFDGSASVGSYQETGYGTLVVQAAGAGLNTSLAVAGSAQLLGALQMDFVDGFTPKTGDAFTVLTAAPVSGKFDTTPQNMTAAYGADSVTLTQN